MLKQILFICCMLVPWSLYAQQPVEMKLWSEGAPDGNGITTPETWPRADRVASVSEPTLIVYPAARPNGLAVIACPGGGYAPGRVLESRGISSNDRESILYRFRKPPFSTGQAEDLIGTYCGYSIYRSRKIADL